MIGLNDVNNRQRYQRSAANFSRVVAGVTDWDAPTPVTEWTARDIVGHLTTWLPGLLGSGAPIAFVPIPDARRDPVAAWAGIDGQVQAILDDEELAGSPFTSTYFEPMSVGEVIDRFFTSDVVFHTWDLAKASGQDPQLDEQYIGAAYDGMQQMSETIRESGQFGEQQPVPEDATPVEEFFAFIGRNPRWTPPA